MYIDIITTISNVKKNYSTPQKITINKDLFFNSLSKKQLELIKNNDKNKFLKTLKHMPLIEDEILHLTSLIQDKTYLINNEVISVTSIQKALLKFWEIDVNNCKDLRNLTLNDIELIEQIPIDKFGYIFPFDKTGANPDKTIVEIIYGIVPSNNNFDDLPKDIYLIDNFTDDIQKTISQKSFFYKSDNSPETLPNQKQNKQIISDADIVKLKKISQEINETTGKYQNIEFALSNNKIYILNLENAKITLPSNDLITWTKSFSEIKTKTTPISFSLQNIIHKEYIKTLTDLFFSYEDKYSELLYFNNEIYNKKDEITNIVKNSPVFLYNPQILFKKFQFCKNIEFSMDDQNKMYLLEYLRFYFKLFKENLIIDKQINKLIENFAELKEEFLLKQNFSVFTLIVLLEKSITLLQIITKYNIYNELLIESKSPNIVLNNKLYNIYTKTISDVDKEIFIKTHKQKYFVSAKMEEEDVIHFIATNNEAKENISNTNNKYYNREEILFTLQTEIYSFIKQLLKELGLNLSLVGIINNIKDIYLLTFEELQNFKFKFFNENIKDLIEKRKIPNETESILEFSTNPEYIDIIHNPIKEMVLETKKELNINDIFISKQNNQQELIFNSHYRTNYYKTVMEQLNINFKEI